ncbi:MAG: hypothetical protein ACK4YU_14495, partial [Paracoccus sp. (in: a-proteobacteria)]
MPNIATADFADWSDAAIWQIAALLLAVVALLVWRRLAHWRQAARTAQDGVEASDRLRQQADEALDKATARAHLSELRTGQLEARLEGQSA